jgi:hypothetical protein
MIPTANSLPANSAPASEASFPGPLLFRRNSGNLRFLLLHALIHSRLPMLRSFTTSSRIVSVRTPRVQQRRTTDEHYIEIEKYTTFNCNNATAHKFIDNGDNNAASHSARVRCRLFSTTYASLPSLAAQVAYSLSSVHGGKVS